MKKSLQKFSAFLAAALLCCCALGFSAAAVDADVVLEYSWVNSGDSTQTGSATATDFEDGWNDVMRKCNGGNIVSVTLYKDWLANDDGDFPDSTINGPGFNWDAIYVNDNADLTLDLNGHTVDRRLGLNSELDGEVIYVDTGAKFTLKNGTVKGGASSNGGGGIHINNAMVSLDNVTISNCHIKNDDGAAIHLDKGTLTMNNCTVKDNTLSDVSFLQCYGIVHANYAAKVEIRNSTFTGVDNFDYGGIIHCKSTDTVIIENCTFKDSHADNEGGAIWVGDHGTVTIEDSTFENCSANDEGGAIFAQNLDKLTIKGCTFTKCRSNIGGAVYMDNNLKTVVENCVFTENYASGNGGAFNFDPAFSRDDEYPTFWMENCTFEKNYSRSSGGAVFFDGLYDTEIEAPSCVARVHGCTFTENETGKQGGAIYLNKQIVLDMTYTTIKNNRAAKQGGGMMVASDTTDPKRVELGDGNRICDNIGLNDRVDNLYISDANTLHLYFNYVAPSDANAIGLRHPGGEMVLGEVSMNSEDALANVMLFSSDNPEWRPMVFNEQRITLRLVSASEYPLPEETPEEDTPAEEPPVEDAPVEDPVEEEIPAEETPAEEIPADEPLPEYTPVETPLMPEAPVEEEAADEASTEEIPADEPLPEYTPVETSPMPEAPVEEEPVEEAPAEDAPAEETPAEEASAEESSEHTGAMVGTGTMPIVLLALCGAVAIAAYVIRAKKKGN